MSIMMFGVSFVVLIHLLRRHPDFSFFGLFVIANWLGMSLSVALSEQLEGFFPELNIRAVDTSAAALLNVYIAWFLFCAIRTYRWLSQYEIVSSTPSFRIGHDATGRRDREYDVFSGLTIVMLVISATVFLSRGIALGQGVPVSQYLGRLTALERLPFMVLIVAVPALSAKFKHCVTSPTCGGWWFWGMLALSPAVAWILAGEKFEYLVMICLYAVYPWRDRISIDKFFVLCIAFMLSALLLCAYYYWTIGYDPLEMLQLRIVVQGQMWWYFAQEPNTFNLASVAAVQFKSTGRDTMHYLMLLCMPHQVLNDYESGIAILSGAFFPAIIHGFGWMGSIVCIPFYAAYFALVTWITRSAVSIGNPFVSFLLVGVFVYPGIEIFVVGNLSRIVNYPPTFCALAGILLVMTYGGIVRVRRIRSISQGRQLIAACAAR
jgi:hypothetical protein